MKPPVVHSFNKSLNAATNDSDLHFWPEIYRLFFRDEFVRCLNMWDLLELQRRGVDRRVLLRGGIYYDIEEKHRPTWRSTDDMLLEYMHQYRDGHTSLGWIAKDLDCHFLNYVWEQAYLAALVRWVDLRAAWLAYGQQWIATYPATRSLNKENGTEWVSIGVAVPLSVIIAAVRNVSFVNWVKRIGWTSVVHNGRVVRVRNWRG